jgi:hypothetical protein
LAGEASTDDRHAVREALIGLVERDPPHPSAGAAVWALGKLCDARLRPFFVRFLSRAVERLNASGGDAWQALVALADAGEASLGGSGGSRNFEENYRRATAFLRREGLL